MTFKVLTPVHDASKNCYVFKFKDAQRFMEVTRDPTKMRVSEDILKDFASDFLSQASQYFSKPLDFTVFFQRVAHSWNTAEFDLTELPSEPVRVCWIPAQILFYTGRYEIHWNLVEMEVEKPKIPSGFMDGLPDLQEVGGTIPFEDPAAGEKERRAKERRRIREARLRTILSKLRAERLAERYFKRYGNFDGVGSESELSSEDELLPPEATAATPK